MIRTIEHARVTSSIEVESSPTLLHIYDQDNLKHILFGTSDGRIGLLDIEKFILKCISVIYSTQLFLLLQYSFIQTLDY